MGCRATAAACTLHRHAERLHGQGLSKSQFRWDPFRCQFRCELTFKRAAFQMSLQPDDGLSAHPTPHTGHSASSVKCRGGTRGCYTCFGALNSKLERVAVRQPQRAPYTTMQERFTRVAHSKVNSGGPLSNVNSGATPSNVNSGAKPYGGVSAHPAQDI